jgi:hypothetical protein
LDHEQNLREIEARWITPATREKIEEGRTEDLRRDICRLILMIRRYEMILRHVQSDYQEQIDKIKKQLELSAKAIDTRSRSPLKGGRN